MNYLRTKEMRCAEQQPSPEGSARVTDKEQAGEIKWFNVGLNIQGFVAYANNRLIRAFLAVHVGEKSKPLPVWIDSAVTYTMSPALRLDSEKISQRTKTSTTLIVSFPIIRPDCPHSYFLFFPFCVLQVSLPPAARRARLSADEA